MIFDAIVEALGGLLAWIAGLIPDGTAPSWFTGLTGSIQTLLGYTEGLGAWIPVQLMLTVTGSYLACIVAGFTIRLVRIVASFVTAGGGSAG